MLYVDKYRPRELDELHYHAELTEQLKALVRWRLPGLVRGFPAFAVLWPDRRG